MTTAQPGPGVSVVIPSYNCANYVGEAVESVLAQSRPPHEVIVVDDGSTDDTATALRPYLGRIRVLSQANRGLPAARNAGAALATAPWIAFLDADDTWLPEKLSRQMTLADDPAVALIYSDRFNTGARGTLPAVQGHRLELYEGDIFVPLLVQGNHLTASSAVVRADVFRALGGFAEHLRAAEDWDLWVRVAENHRVAVCREPLVCYRYHATQMSGDPRRMRDARREVVDRALATPRGRALDPGVRREILGSVARNNAMGLSRHGAWRAALVEYRAALTATPFDRRIYVDLLRFLLRRHT